MIDSEFQPIVEAATQGGAQLKKYFGQSLSVINEKLGPADLQTTADLESERAILEVLNKHYPSYNIFSEEAGMIDRGSNRTFYIDPLDGTNNFVLGIPYFSSSIALLEGRDVIASVVYSPIIEHMYVAQKGRGAFLNNQKISVNGETDIRRATVAYNTGYDVQQHENLAMAKGILGLSIKRYLTNWSPALDMSFLARGSIEVMVINRGEFHDFLGGHLIAQEAGAVITDFAGNERKHDDEKTFVVSSSKEIQEKIISVTAAL